MEIKLKKSCHKNKSGHRTYVCNDCPGERKNLPRKNWKEYEACQKLNLCAICYNKKVREGLI